MAEIVACPGCRKKLQVPEQYLGQRVQCPECQHTFTATTAPVSVPAATPAPAGPGEKQRDREYDRPRRRRYDDDRADEDDRDYDLRRGHGRYHYAPHRGGTILALGLISLLTPWFICGLTLVLGPIAWIMANNDLREIRAGRMDPGGEGQTRAGQVCGIIATILLVLGGLIFCLAIGKDALR